MRWAAIAIALAGCKAAAVGVTPPTRPVLACAIISSSSDPSVHSIRDDVRVVAPSHAELTCVDPQRKHCVAQLSARVVNGSRYPIIVGGSLMSYDSHQPRIATDVEATKHRLEPGEAWSFKATVSGEGDPSVAVMVLTPSVNVFDGPGCEGTVALDFSQHALLGDILSEPIHVTSPARAAAIAACNTCRGDWGRHGMVQTIDPSPGADQGEDCLCRSRDNGKHCEDAVDCEGWCEFDRFVKTGKRGGIDVGYSVGHCSEFTDQQSCATRIPRGARARRPAPLETDESCVD